MTWENALQAIYIPLMSFSLWSTYALWTRVGWPALRDGHVMRYVLGFGGCFVSTALAGECLLFGVGRWFPQATRWLWDVYPLVGVLKLIFLIGMILTLGCLVAVERRPQMLTRLVLLAAALWGISMAIATFTD